MLSTSSRQRIYLAAEPVDMRGGFDRLAGRVKQAGLDLYAGHLFVFVSRRRPRNPHQQMPWRLFPRFRARSKSPPTASMFWSAGCLANSRRRAAPRHRMPGMQCASGVDES
jgi:hypothetical protein